MVNSKASPLEATPPDNSDFQAFASAIDCVLDGRRAVYASSPVTTGMYYYQLLSESGTSRVGSPATEALAEQVRQRNTVEASRFARILRSRLGKDTPVVNPAPLFVPSWGQREYLGFWESFIASRVSSAYFNFEWPYSHGCTFEFRVAQELDLPTFDAEGQPLDLHSGIELIASAVEDLSRRGFEAKALRTQLSVLEELARYGHPRGASIPARDS